MVSDSTGETAIHVGRASLVQFENIHANEHVWSMVRSERQIEEALENIRQNPGFVIFTLVDEQLRARLERGCREIKVPCIPILDPVVAALGSYLGAEIKASPGRQHALDSEYYSRIEAMQFALNHDDGQSTWNLDQADVIIVGVSRTSKTPTCIYLANRGIKAANVPFVPGCPLPEEVFKPQRPLIVGLTKDPKRLVQIRRNRLRMLEQDQETDYVDLEMVSKEVNEARRLFDTYKWPVIDVTRRSIEETAATIMQLYQRRKESSP
jgi:regulator of PEP synthase PpsR (kinase-PPPase family)